MLHAYFLLTRGLRIIGLEALNSDDRKKHVGQSVQQVVPKDRPPMTVTEKIFAMHAIDSKGYVRTGETIRVSLDWIMASEASWAVRYILDLTSHWHRTNIS